MEPGHEDREDVTAQGDGGDVPPQAAMEPGHEDREDRPKTWPPTWIGESPQWSPVTKTGKTGGIPHSGERTSDAAMEPGHEDREDTTDYGATDNAPTGRNGARSRRPGRRRHPSRSSDPVSRPQWSPVTKTGKTGRYVDPALVKERAAMELGHEDREDYTLIYPTGFHSGGRNGARSRRPGRPAVTLLSRAPLIPPQWSPVTKTGTPSSAPTSRR